jgi:cell division protein ZapD
MLNPSQTEIEPDPSPEELRFEQPLTERMRTFLRIEFLHAQARYHMVHESDFGARATVSSLLEILAIIGRGDVRSDVLKELERQAEMLAHFRRTPGVDADRLSQLIGKLERLKDGLTVIGMNFLQPLKDCDFLSAIKHRSTIPGGTCTFDLPDYGYWLYLPHTVRHEQVRKWMDLLDPLCMAVAELLWMTREATEPVDCVAEAGFFQHNVDRNIQLNLVCVQLPKDHGLFPEISAGRHRFTVRFVSWQGVDARPAQTSEDVHFRLALS